MCDPYKSLTYFIQRSTIFLIMNTQKENPSVTTRVATEATRPVVESKKPSGSHNPTWRMVAEDAFRAGCLINAD